MGQRVENCDLQAEFNGANVVGWQPKVHTEEVAQLSGGPYNSEAPHLSGSAFYACKNASGSQSGFDAAMAQTQAASWYAGLPTNYTSPDNNALNYKNAIRLAVSVTG